MRNFNFDEAIKAIPERQIALGLQLMARLNLSAAEVTSLSVEDLIFSSGQIRIMLHGLPFFVTMGTHAEWLQREVTDMDLQPEELLVPVSPRVMATALKLALQDIGETPPPSPYDLLIHLRTAKIF